MDLFAKHLKKPNPIPKDIFTDINYANDLNWMIMSSEGTGKIKNDIVYVGTKGDGNIWH